MKATEFVKKYGWSEAINLLNATSWTMRQIALSTLVDTNDLQNLVNAYELVEKLGGLEKSKLKVQGNRLSHKKTADLWKAIKLVESVNE